MVFLSSRSMLLSDTTYMRDPRKCTMSDKNVIEGQPGHKCSNTMFQAVFLLAVSSQTIFLH